MMAESRVAIETLARLGEDAFEGDSDESLIANLRDMRDGDWTTRPAGGERTIADILEHVGWAKWMYEDYAFGSGTMRGDEPPLIPADGATSRPHSELLEWLREGHQRWLTSGRSERYSSACCVRTTGSPRPPRRRADRLGLSTNAVVPIQPMHLPPHAAYGRGMAPPVKPPDTGPASCATCGHSDWVHSNTGYRRCLKVECSCSGFIVGAAPDLSAQVFPA